MVASELKPKKFTHTAFFFVHVFPVLRLCRPKAGRDEIVICLEVTKKTFTYEHTEPIKLAIKYVLGFGSLAGGGKHELVTVN